METVLAPRGPIAVDALIDVYRRGPNLEYAHAGEATTIRSALTDAAGVLDPDECLDPFPVGVNAIVPDREPVVPASAAVQPADESRPIGAG